MSHACQQIQTAACDIHTTHNRTDTLQKPDHIMYHTGTELYMQMMKGSGAYRVPAVLHEGHQLRGRATPMQAH